jgi:hypothetical protein
VSADTLKREKHGDQGEELGIVVNLKDLFPKASNGFLKANAKILNAIAPDIRAADKTFTPDPPKVTRRGIMNKVEREFSFILESQKRNGDILRYEFEGVTLRFNGLRYTPDFAVWPSAFAVSGQLKFIEIKGAFAKGKFERAIERFRHAKTYYGDVFLFELHQKTRDGWRQIL